MRHAWAAGKAWRRDFVRVVVTMHGRPRATPWLVDRQREREALDDLLEDLRSGPGWTLVVRGEAGVGKSALLEYVVGGASDMRVVRAAGVESEMELAFASLHQLCVPLLDGLDRLPAPQRDALGTAFGLRGGGVPDRFMVGSGALTLLSEAAEERPLLCVIDDAQWLDQASAQAVGFAARRLLAERIGLMFAAREPVAQLCGLPELEVRGLGNEDARALLHSVVRVRLDEQVRDRIVAETRGNPLALLELPRGLSPTQLAGGFGLAATQAVPARVEESFQRRLEGLPDDTRLLLLVAAAEPVGDPVVVWQAAERLGVATSAAAAAEADGLLEIGTQVRFRHPLVRSAVYRSAALQERQAAHLALAAVTDRDLDPDRRAWHLAAAAPGPDEEAASELERSAGRAQARGGVAAAAAFLQRAVALTREPARRSERALAAAQTSLQAGAFDTASQLLDLAAAGPLDELQQALANLLRGQIAFASSSGGDAPALLMSAAQHLEALDAGLARETYLHAWVAASIAGRFARAGDLADVSRAARSAPPPTGPPRPSDLLMDGLAVLVTEGRRAAAPLLSRATQVFAGDQITIVERVRWGLPATMAALMLWDEESWHTIGARELQGCRETGLLAQLALSANGVACLAVSRGEFGAAASLIAEAEAIAAATGTLFPRLRACCSRGIAGQSPKLSPDQVGDDRCASRGAGCSSPTRTLGVRHSL